MDSVGCEHDVKEMDLSEPGALSRLCCGNGRFWANAAAHSPAATELELPIQGIRMSSRRQLREKVMQALYAFELGGGDVSHVMKNVLREGLEEDPPGRKFAESLYLRTLDHQKELDEIIERHLEHWDLDRVALVDRILLRVAICELLTFEDIPPKVSINEAIEVAKRFSTPKSGKFINGILDAVLLELQHEGRLNKSGRGLVGMQPVRDRTLP